MTLNINNREVVEFSNKLEKLHRSHMPVAVRATLNDAAFLGRRQSLNLFDKNFIVRKKGFARSHTIVKKSINTFNINQMVSAFGVPRGKSFAGDQLEKQELGGTISGRDVPLIPARAGKRIKGRISKRYYKNLWDSKPIGIISQTSTAKILKTEKGLFRINKGGKFDILYLLNKDVTIKKNPFIYPAGRFAGAKMNQLFIKNAKKRIEKSLKK